MCTSCAQIQNCNPQSAEKPGYHDDQLFGKINAWLHAAVMLLHLSYLMFVFFLNVTHRTVWASDWCVK